ncbi:hypothetical protein Q7P36_010677 [Cladosporium allicinum]
MPHEALSGRDLDRYDYLTLALLELEKPGTRTATAIRLLRQALVGGCDPNASYQNPSANPCGQSKWERWLRAQYVSSQRHSRASKGDKVHQSTGVTKDIDCQRIRENASIIELLLRHGADPNCTPCTTDHRFDHVCSPTALHGVLKSIVPADCLSPLQTFLVACSSEDRHYTLRRSQRKRAIGSYIISEQRFVSRVVNLCPQGLQQNEREELANDGWYVWQRHQELFLQSLIVFDDIDAECETWDKCQKYTGLLTWCVDYISNCRITQPEGHTTVAMFFEILPGYPYHERMRWKFDLVGPTSLSKAYQSLGYEPGELDLTPKAAISVLKEWYARNPIEPDSLQGNDFQDIASPEELDVAALSIGGPNTDETPIAEREHSLDRPPRSEICCIVKLERRSTHKSWGLESPGRSFRECSISGAGVGAQYGRAFKPLLTTKKQFSFLL